LRSPPRTNTKASTAVLGNRTPERRKGGSLGDDDSCSNSSSPLSGDSDRSSRRLASPARSLRKRSSSPTNMRDHINRVVRSVVNVKLTNVFMQLRKCCNHPYLLDYPLDESGD